MRQECAICGLTKDIKNFRYGYGRERISLTCKTCLNKLSKRLDMLTAIDKQICKELQLDYWKVTNHEQLIRKKGIYREHLRTSSGAIPTKEEILDQDLK